MREGTIRPTREKILSLQQLIGSFYRNQYLPAHKWRSFIGTLTSLEKFIPLGRLHIRPFQWLLADHWNQISDPPGIMIPVLPHIRKELSWWSRTHNLAAGVPWVPPEPNLRIFTDASHQGWGAHSGDTTFQDVWSHQESSLHINVLELRAIRLALGRFSIPSGSHVLVASDNSTVVAYVNKQGGTRSRPLWEETKSLFHLTTSLQISIRARHIAGRLNVIADQLSRDGQVLQTEWSLNQELVDTIFHSWDHPQVDLFSTRFNHKCPLFVSPVPDPLAWQIDALAISWEGLFAYAYPPHVIMPQVLSKFSRTNKCKLILIAPLWPNQSWFPLLETLSSQDPIKIPVTRTMLRQPRSRTFHPNPELLNLHAWLLVKQS